MIKRTSKRRWKARIALGRWVPKMAIVEYGLTFPGGWEMNILYEAYRKST